MSFFFFFQLLQFLKQQLLQLSCCVQTLNILLIITDALLSIMKESLQGTGPALEVPKPTDISKKTDDL